MRTISGDRYVTSVVPTKETGLARSWDTNARARLAELSESDDPSYLDLCYSLLEFLRTTGAPTHGRVLDAGCGLGYFTEMLVDAGYDAAGIDPAELTIDLARSAHPRIADRFAAESIERRAERDVLRFDLIVANMVLHTTPSLVGFLTAASRLLKPGGLLVAAIPNPKTYLQTRDDLGVNLAQTDLSIEQDLEIKFRIKDHAPHPAPIPFFHRPLRIYSVSAEMAGLRIDDYDVPDQIGPGRPKDITFLTFRHLVRS